MVSVDGIPMHCLVKSEVMRELFEETGNNLPKSPSTIVSILKKHYEKATEDLKKRLNDSINDGVRFSITLDEWSSVRRRRYLNVNLHTKKDEFNLGLIRILGKCTAEKLVELIKQHLSIFGINMEKHVIGSSTDGCNFMLKFGRVSGIEHHVCDLHTLHLAVVDFFYPKKRKSTLENVEDTDMDSEESDDEEDDDEMGELHLEVEAEIGAEEIRDDIRSQLKAVRKIVNFFNNSDIKNSILQKFVKSHFDNEQKELELLKDFKVRWITIPPMINRFLLLKVPIMNALRELRKLDLLENIDFELLKNLSNALAPLETATKKIEERCTTIVESELIIEMLCKKLSSNGDALSKELSELIIERHEQRRNIKLVSLARYVQNPKFLKESNLFPYSSKPLIHQYAKNIMKRVHSDMYESDSEDENEETQETSQSEDSFLWEINQRLSAESNKRPKLSTSFQKELNLFETTGTMTRSIEKLKAGLDSIPASSAEAERTFSLAGRICNKIRSRLSDITLHVIVFLRKFLSK